VRGVVRRPIVFDDRDRFVLRNHVAATFVDHQAKALVWAFMTNHFHVVVRTGEPPLSRLMQSLLSLYATEFNRRHGATGHVFQGRFGSRQIDGDADLKGIFRYVLRNPVEAGIVANLEALERHRWCAYGALLGLRAPFDFEDFSEIRSLFHEDDEAGRVQLREWMSLTPSESPAQAAFDDLLGEVCRELGVAMSDVLGGSRALAASRARAAI
jgi:REP element-mobilizing transposase RayT